MKISARIWKPVWVHLVMETGKRFSVRPSSVDAIGPQPSGALYFIRKTRKWKRRKAKPITMVCIRHDAYFVRGSVAEIRSKIEQGIRKEIERAGHAAALIASGPTNRRRRRRAA